MSSGYGGTLESVGESRSNPWRSTRHFPVFSSTFLHGNPSTFSKALQYIQFQLKFPLLSDQLFAPSFPHKPNGGQTPQVCLQVRGQEYRMSNPVLKVDEIGKFVKGHGWSDAKVRSNLWKEHIVYHFPFLSFFLLHVNRLTFFPRLHNRCCFYESIHTLKSASCSMFPF